MVQEPTEPGWPTDAVCNALVADWHIYQRSGGHRSSTDDVLVAWLAVTQASCSPDTYLDLGCGVGSVLLLVTHALRPRSALGVEAQPQSVVLLQRSLAELPGGAASLEVVQADFRTLEMNGARFDIITGSPPYFPLGTGVEPKDGQRRACRFEVRGGVEGYLATMARLLNPRGRGYLVFPWVQRQRLLQAATQVGLCVTLEVPFVMRRGRENPFLAAFELADTSLHEAQIRREPVVIREPDGSFSSVFEELRQELRQRKF